MLSALLIAMGTLAVLGLLGILANWLFKEMD